MYLFIFRNTECFLASEMSKCMLTVSLDRTTIQSTRCLATFSQHGHRRGVNQQMWKSNV